MSLSTRLTRPTARLISAIAMAALATIMLAPLAQAQDISVSIDDESGLVGDTVEVPVSTGEITSGDDVTSFEFDVGYDTTVVEPVGVVTDGTLSSGLGNVFLSEAPGADDNFRVSGAGTQAITGSGTLVEIRLAVEETGTSSLSFNSFLYNDGTPSTSAQDGTLTGANTLVSFPDEFQARGPGELQPADTVEVPVSTTNLTSGNDVTSFEFDVGYDTTVVEPVGVVTDGTLSSGLGNVFLSEAPGADDNFRVSGAGTQAITGSGTLVEIRLAVETGTSPLSFNSFLYNDGTPPAATQDGTLNAEGPDFTLGDPSENGSVSALDASITLRAAAELDTLTTAQQAAADVDGDASVTSNDASLILQFVVGIIEEFPAESSSSSASTQAIAAAGELEWGEVKSDDGAQSLPVRLSGSGDVQAMSLTLQGDVSALDLAGISDRLPDGWQLMHRRFEGESEAKIVMAGARPISDGGEVLRLPIKDGEPAPSVEATARVNGSQAVSMGRAPVPDRPGSFSLRGNFPNPVSQSTAITFDAPQSATVTVEVYDILGRRVLSTEGRRVSAGQDRSIKVDAAGLSSGAYIYRLKAETGGQEASEWTDSGRMTVVK